MNIQPVSFPSISSIGGLPGVEGLGTPIGAGATTDGRAFGVDLAGAVDNLQSMQATSSALGVKAVSGDLDDVHDYTVASSQSKLALELTAAVRNKAIDAFTEIMRMQA